MGQLGKNEELDGNGFLLYESLCSALSMLFYMRGARYKNSIALHDWPAPPACAGSAHQKKQSRGGSFDGPHFAMEACAQQLPCRKKWVEVAATAYGMVPMASD
jgi:hypothetical protein